MRLGSGSAAIIAAIAVVSAAATLGLGHLRFFELLKLKAQDVHFILRGPKPVKDIVILGIDNETIARYPKPFLLWHEYYAQAMLAAARGGAKVFVLDVTFGIPVAAYVGPEWASSDADLAAAFAKSSETMPVICAYVPEAMGAQNEAQSAVPLNMMLGVTGMGAYANITDDADAFVRRQELIEGGGGDRPLVRSMALLAAEKFLGREARLSGGDVYLGARRIPADNRQMLINFAGPPGTVPVIPLYKFLDAARAGDVAQLNRWVGGKVAMLGPYSFDDRHNTPFYTFFAGNKFTTPGVEVHANTLNTLLTGDFLQPVPRWVRFGGLLLAAGAGVGVAVAVGAAQTVIWSVLALVLGFVATHVLFRAGWLFSSSEVLLSFSLALVGGVVYRFATAERKSSFFRGAVELFVGKQVAQSLDRSRKISLQGKRQVVTILFTDIRGFTAFCESKDPAAVVDLLNAYMRKMVAIIVKHHGHVNKFIGDGILAVFSDDDDGATAGDHACRALACATELVQAEAGEFRTGAGLHSGEVVIGNVGSSDKMEFTVLGDTVNLASRLEGLNKEQNTKLLFSSETREMSGGRIDTLYVGEVRVRGKSEPMKLFTVRSLMGLLVALGFLAAAAPVRAAGAKEEPVGLVLAAGSAKVVRAGDETALAARVGDVLFSGDELRAESTAATFVFCPGKTSQTLDAGSSAILEAKQVRVRRGRISAAKPVNSCFLPQLVRVNVASQQHYGVSMTRGLLHPDGEVLSLASLDAAVRTDLQPFEAALAANANDAAALVQEAAVFDRHHLDANALSAYRRVAAQWKDAVWVRGRIFELEESLAAQAALKAAGIAPDAKTYALLIGVSKYQKLPSDLWLQYADADARTFSEHISSLRGGGVPPDQMVVLTNEGATTAAVRNAFQTFLKNRAGKKDTIFILVAGHGTVDSRGAYILTYDSDPEDLSATALPMAELQGLVDEELQKVGRVVFLADVCRAATIGSLKTDALGGAVEKLGQAQGEMLGLMAARPKEVSLEGSAFGGGHGAFTYSVLKGLNGSADHNDDRAIEAGELIDFVRDNVASLTNGRQHPRDFGNMENATKLSDLSKPGIPLARVKTFYDSRTGEPLLFAQAAGNPRITPQAQADIDAYQAAIAARRILPEDQGSAWTVLDRLRGELGPAMTLLQENALRVALEDQAQQVLLRYLAGGQTQQVKTDFENGAKYMEAAARLTPESLYLKARDSFFSGRALLFEKQYAQASDLLEQAVRTDPGEAYGYNALGISYLEQAKYQQAIPAFRDAAKRAPNWAYPMLGLALTYEQAGNNPAAVRTYQQAMKVTPRYGFLPFNLGLVYQKMNRRGDAEAAYRKAEALMPNDGGPLNALGALRASEGRNSEAERFYRESIAKDPAKLEARHNLGVLLAGIRNRENEAIALWRENLTKDPQYLTSRISLAELLARRADSAGAIAEYREIVNERPEFVAARMALAELLISGNQIEAGLAELRAASRLDAQNAVVWERIGDAEKSLNHATEARDAWAQAMKLEIEKADRKRVRNKMAF